MMVLMRACRMSRVSVGAGVGSDFGNEAYSVRTSPRRLCVGTSGIGS